MKLHEINKVLSYVSTIKHNSLQGSQLSLVYAARQHCQKTPERCLTGVFDGHGGETAAEYLSRHLYHVLATNVPEKTFAGKCEEGGMLNLFALEECTPLTHQKHQHTSLVPHSPLQEAHCFTSSEFVPKKSINPQLLDWHNSQNLRNLDWSKTCPPGSVHHVLRKVKSD